MLKISKKKSNILINKEKVIRSVSKASAGNGGCIRKGIKNGSDQGKKIFFKIFVGFLWLIFIGSIGYILLFSPFMEIGSVSVEGNESLSQDDVRSVAEAEIYGKYFDIFPKNNFILADSNGIEVAISKRFKRVESVKVKKIFTNGMMLEITERKSKLVFADGEHQWVINDKGEAYAEADFGTNDLGERDLIILRDMSQKNIPQKEIFLDESLIFFMEDVRKKLLDEASIETEKEFRTPALISGDLRIKTIEGWEIYLNKNLGEGKSIEMLKAVLDSNFIEKEKRTALEYMDLRVINKAYYKLKKIEDVAVENKEKNSEESK